MHKTADSRLETRNVESFALALAIAGVLPFVLWRFSQVDRDGHDLG